MCHHSKHEDPCEVCREERATFDDRQEASSQTHAGLHPFHFPHSLRHLFEQGMGECDSSAYSGTLERRCRNGEPFFLLI